MFYLCFTHTQKTAVNRITPLSLLIRVHLRLKAMADKEGNQNYVHAWQRVLPLATQKIKQASQGD